MSRRDQRRGTLVLKEKQKQEFKTYLLHRNYVEDIATRDKGDPRLSRTERKDLIGAARSHYFTKPPANKFVEMKFDVKQRMEHEKRVLQATKLIDNDAPRLFPRMPRTERAAFRLDDMMLENKQLLERICTIWRTKHHSVTEAGMCFVSGLVDSSCPTIIRKSNYRQRMWDAVRIEAQNVALLYFIQKATPHVPTRKDCARDFKIAVDKMRFICKYPLQFLKDSNVDHPLPMENPPAVDPLAPPRKRVFMDFITSKQRALGRIEMELFEEQAPVTVSNFLTYIRGSGRPSTAVALEGDDEDGGGRPAGRPLSYQGTPMHRILPGYFCLGGDVTHYNGMGGASIQGGQVFADEKNDLQHSEAGLLCTIGSEPDSNDSKFMITMKPLPVLDDRSTVFGRVIKGFEVLWAISALGARGSGKPLEQVICSSCGEVQRSKEGRRRRRLAKKRPVRAQLRSRPQQRQQELAASAGTGRRSAALQSVNSSNVSPTQSASQVSRTQPNHQT